MRSRVEHAACGYGRRTSRSPRFSAGVEVKHPAAGGRAASLCESGLPATSEGWSYNGRMRRSFPEIVSIGYEGRDVEALIRQLQSLRVDVLVDVRLNPISRKRGMSKVALREALEAHGIRYVHHRELGNPKDNRDGYRSGDHAAYRRFEQLLESPAAEGALQHVTELLDGECVALLCFERDHSQCHRALVVQALREREPELFVHEV